MIDLESGELLIENNSYFVQDKRRFLAYANMTAQDKQTCFDFAYDMSYGREGEHRDHRTGGNLHRTKGQIFINTFQGKMAEFAVYRYFRSRNIELDEPDVNRYNLGEWDSFDLNCQRKHMSIKSTKFYGNLLLLETKDWNENGEYIPNINEGNARYDYTILVRFKPDGEKIMKEQNLLFQKDDAVPQNIKEILAEKIRDVTWSYDFAGFIYYSELVKMIRDRKIIPQNALLNGKVSMDAENYYFQTGNMHSMVEMYTYNPEESDDRAEVRLIRRCPDCGERLTLRNGRHGWFWGCTGFGKTGCRHTEPIEK